MSDNIAYILPDPNNREGERGMPYSDEGDLHTQAYFKPVRFQVLKARFNAGGESRAIFVSAHQRFVSLRPIGGNHVE